MASNRLKEVFQRLTGRQPTHQPLPTDDIEMAQPPPPATAAAPTNRPTRGPASSEPTRKHSHIRYLLRLLPYLWPRGKYGLQFRVVFCLMLLGVSKLVNVTTPFFYKSAVDVLSVPENAQLPLLAIVIYGFGRATVSLADNLRDTVFLKVTQEAMQSAAIQTFSHLHELSIQFHIQRKTGSILRAIDRGTASISWITSWTLFNIFPIFIEITLVCSVMIVRYTFWLAIITAAMMVAYVAFTVIVTEWRTKIRRQMNELDNATNDKAVDSLINFETVKAFCNEDHETERFRTAFRAYTAMQYKSQSSLGVLNVGQAVIVALGQFGVMMFSAYQVTSEDSSMNVGDFVLLNTYILQLYAPLSFLGTSYRMVKQSLIDVEKMYDLLDEQPDIQDAPDALPLPNYPLRGDIKFENVQFAYPSDKDKLILQDISFEVPAGKTMAIVSPSGGGKSTICRLLFRFYDIPSGKISVDGTDVTRLRQKELRSQIGIVPQDTVLFNDTVFYNISYGKIGATEEEVYRAAQLAGIHDRILSFPDGYKTVVGERGLRLSGGEKQRVAIARCLLKSPRIMILDEATSALDSHTEKEIQENLRTNFMGKVTCIMVAHRLSTIIDADEIIVLSGGKIVERGTHEQLLQIEGGEYQSLWYKQLQQQTSPEILEDAESSVSPVAGGGEPQ